MSHEPLSFDLSDTDTAFPVLIQQDALAIVSNISVEDSKNRPGARNLKITFKTAARTTSEAGAAKGEQSDIPAGHVLVRYLPLQPNPEKPDFDFKKGLAEFQDAVLGTTINNRPPFTPLDGSYVGKELILKVRPKKDDGSAQHVPGTDISRFVALKV